MEKIVSINDRLLADALHISGLESVDDVVKQGLTMLIKIKSNKQTRIKKYFGTMQWNPEPNTNEVLTDRIRAVR